MTDVLFVCGAPGTAEAVAEAIAASRGVPARRLGPALGQWMEQERAGTAYRIRLLGMMGAAVGPVLAGLPAAAPPMPPLAPGAVAAVIDLLPEAPALRAVAHLLAALPEARALVLHEDALGQVAQRRRQAPAMPLATLCRAWAGMTEALDAIAAAAPERVTVLDLVGPPERRQQALDGIPGLDAAARATLAAALPGAAPLRMRDLPWSLPEKLDLVAVCGPLLARRGLMLDPEDAIRTAPLRLEELVAHERVMSFGARLERMPRPGMVRLSALEPGVAGLAPGIRAACLPWLALAQRTRLSAELTSLPEADGPVLVRVALATALTGRSLVARDVSLAPGGRIDLDMVLPATNELAHLTLALLGSPAVGEGCLFHQCRIGSA